MIYGIQILRGFAALLVVYVHFLNNLIARNSIEINMITDWFQIWGDFGVDVFFVISGFVMAGALAKREDAHIFLKQRIIRIYPVYICNLSILLCLMAFAGTLDFSVLRVIESFLLVPSREGDHITMILGPAWTLTFELVFYFICFIAILMLKPIWYGRHLFLVGFLLLAGFFVSNLFVTFIFGIICWWIINIVPKLYFLIIFITLGIFATLIWWNYDFNQHWQLNEFRWFYFGIPAFFVVLVFSSIGTRNFPLEYLGDISYSIYLTHMSVTIHAYGKFSEFVDFPFYVHFVCISVVSISVGAIFYEFIEKPLLRALRRIF